MPWAAERLGERSAPHHQTGLGRAVSRVHIGPDVRPLTDAMKTMVPPPVVTIRRPSSCESRNLVAEVHVDLPVERLVRHVEDRLPLGHADDVDEAVDALEVLLGEHPPASGRSRLGW